MAYVKITHRMAQIKREFIPYKNTSSVKNAALRQIRAKYGMSLDYTIPKHGMIETGRSASEIRHTC